MADVDQGRAATGGGHTVPEQAAGGVAAHQCSKTSLPCLGHNLRHGHGIHPQSLEDGEGEEGGGRREEEGDARTRNTRRRVKEEGGGGRFLVIFVDQKSTIVTLFLA